MKLLTLNTHSLIEGRGAEQASVLAKAILAEQFDVVALQEVNQECNAKPLGKHAMEYFAQCSEDVPVREGNFAYEVMKCLFSSGVCYYGGYLPVKKGYGKYDEGLAFLCRSPMVAWESAPLSLGRSYDDWKTRSMLAVRCEGRTDWFFNLHLGWWDDMEEPFVAQWKRLLPHLLEKDRYWLMGDFNNPAEVRGEGYDLLCESGLFDAYEMACRRRGCGTARAKIDGWCGRKMAYDWLRIDQIFCNQSRPVVCYETLFDGKNYSEISDHLGVAVTVSENNETERGEA